MLAVFGRKGKGKNNAEEVPARKDMLIHPTCMHIARRTGTGRPGISGARRNHPCQIAHAGGLLASGGVARYPQP
jgi:hypothetical protein